jgi:hypothetical protein
MESALDIPLPLQFLAALIFVPIESYLASLVAKIFCDWWLLRDFDPWMSGNDVFLAVAGIVILLGVVWMREKTRLNWFLVALVSILVTVIVCLNLWGFR